MTLEFRTCQHCKKSAPVYIDGGYVLVKYGIRHYAHPVCLAKKVGTVAARESIPEHQREDFDIALLDADGWDAALVEVKDKQLANRGARAAVRP